MQIPLTKPHTGTEEKEAVSKVLDSGWLIQGKKVAEFEEMVCQYTGARYARATSSCTTALHLALLALGIGKGDEVLVPSFTFIATANAVEYVGAKPVFIDIDLKTFNIDVQKAEEYLEWSKSKAKAIMPVHIFGLCADMDAIVRLAKRYDVFIMEDAACALGSLYKGKHAGTFGNAGCFSFHPRKTITTGEGGMLITDSSEIALAIEKLRNQGASISGLALHEKGGTLFPGFDVLGYNYRMTDMQGAIGVEQMLKAQWIIDKRIEKAKIYDEALKSMDWLQAPCVPEECNHTYQSYVVMILDEVGRNKIMAKLAEKGIATRQGTTAVHALEYYKSKYNISESDYPNSLAADKLSITLPLYPTMTEEEQSYVIENLLKARKEIS
jgi:dTDP-4-amino-4,6-dideoxygalactose transaminase